MRPRGPAIACGSRCGCEGWGSCGGEGGNFALRLHRTGAVGGGGVEGRDTQEHTDRKKKKNVAHTL